MHRVNIHLTNSEVKCLDLISEVTGSCRSEIIRRAIDEYIKRKKFEGFVGLDQIEGV